MLRGEGKTLRQADTEHRAALWCVCVCVCVQSRKKMSAHTHLTSALNKKKLFLFYIAYWWLFIYDVSQLVPETTHDMTF